MEAELRKRVSLRNPYHFLALGFGSGLIPLMPGTMGSIAAIPVVLLASLANIQGFILITVLACLLGVLICQRASDAMGVHDHGSIVWDEIAGMLVTFLFIPITPITIIAGFVLFRLFDILKPWPISFLDKHVHGGFGIMLDDIIAGLMACACLHWLVLPLLF
ncbi:phosphatidylglycerophosphatase A [Alteromonas facilis]|uniref:phosphatidylglycerophosphatase A family protein n=1 Tax=Alteromonas facilis TaxID=2048004 RepID=UPI000C2834CB|nr:phosphatidylglycerophosphatase A [Alteromonas facilis]